MDSGGDSLDVFQTLGVVTPWSNPGSHSWTGSTFAATTVGIEVSSFNAADKSFSLKIRLSNPEELLPSRPQNLRVQFDANWNHLLTWSANLEPDLVRYNIFRQIDGVDSDYQFLGWVASTSTSYTDDIQAIKSTIANRIVRYRICAADNQSLDSDFSDVAEIINTPASAPQNLVMTNSWAENENPNLTWDANPELDVVGYDVWRELGNKFDGWSTTRIAIKYNGTSYTDYDVKTSSTFIRDDVRYWIKAADAIEQRSASSNVVASAVKSGPIEERAQDGALVLVEKPAEFRLRQNSPNPFNPSTVIQFELPVAGVVSITIHDLLGRTVAELMKRHMSAGFHQVTFDAGDLPSGAYIYKFSAQPIEGELKPFVQTKKMVLTR